MMSLKSSSKPLMIEKLTSGTDLVINLKGSSCWSSNLSYTSEIASFFEYRGEVERYPYMNVGGGGHITANIFKE